MTVEDYRNLDSKYLNYSLLSALDKSPESLTFEDKDFSDAMKMGDAIDILMFTPDEFDKKYIVADVAQPTGQVLELVNECYTKNYFTDFEIQLEADSLKEEGKFKYFGSTKKPDLRKANWDNDLFKNYLKFLRETEDKIVISIEENEAISLAVETLKSHEFTKDIFNPDSKYEVQRQWALTFDYDEFSYKILLDYVLIDHENKVIKPFDLKILSSGIWNFIKQHYRFRYYIQSSLYRHGLIVLYPDYTVEDFKDIVYSTVSKKPLIFNMSSYHEKARDGWTDNNITYKGWLQLSRDLSWHRENNLWQFSKEIYDNKGEILL
jgi:hypothetical protein